MSKDIHSVGVIGLGAMGMGVAQSLLRGGFEVHACDVRRTRSRRSSTPEAIAPTRRPYWAKTSMR